MSRAKQGCCAVSVLVVACLGLTGLAATGVEGRQVKHVDEKGRSAYGQTMTIEGWVFAGEDKYQSLRREWAGQKWPTTDGEFCQHIWTLDFSGDVCFEGQPSKEKEGVY